jgi:hypothetical protein
MKRRLALLVAAVVIAAPAYVILNSAPAGANVHLSFTQHLTNFEAVINGQHTATPMTLPGPGDTFIFRSDLLQNGVAVGFSNDICTETFNLNAMCNTVFAFTNKGDLMGTTLTRGPDPSVYDDAITGGTFAYRNAHGDAHAVVSGGNVNWTVNFVTQ